MRARAVLWAGAGGLALALAFPKLAWWPLAWVALTPLLALSLLHPDWTVLLSGACGLAFHAANLPWIQSVMVDYGGITPLLALAVYFLLVLYLASFWLGFGFLLRSAVRRMGPRAMVLAPFFWVAIELARNFPFGGFPWCLLGYSQVSSLPVLQLASVTGIHGISFLLVGAQACLVLWCVSEDEVGALFRKRVSLVVGAAVGLVWGFGLWSLSQPIPTPDLVVSAVQGNVQQGQKWDPQYAVRIFSDHMALSQRAADDGARLIVWPESSTPFYFDGTPQIAEHMKRFAKERNVALLFGGDDRETNPEGELVAYNGAKLIEPDGELRFRYRKIHLVPFGEYVPLPDWLGLGTMVQAVGNFRPGTETSTGPLEEGSFGVSICYEVIYGSLTREFVRRGAGLLVNITNDAWFRTSAAPYQHFAMAKARTVETRRYMVRAANTGISAFIDPYGRTLSKTKLFTQTVLSGRVSLRDGQTPFVRFGNLIGLVSVVLTCSYISRLWWLRLRPLRA